MTTVADAPVQPTLQRADGVEIIGEMAGSGYRVPPSLVRRADGQTIQLTPLLLEILRAIDGSRGDGEIAAAVSAATGRSVSADNVRQLVGTQLRPLGLLVCEDGSQPLVRKRNPLLGIRFRYAITDPDRTRKITEPFQFLFRSWAVIPLLLAFGAVCWWVFLRKGLAAATWDAFERPGLLILVFIITILSAGFHEFGHAAAAKYGGATPGVMGFGIYLVWPAFYTDVTDSYRLSRRGRLRTDLGGLYFNAIVAVVITGVWMVLRYDALLLIVATQILQMLRQLAPMVRFDGYHVVADITGVPDLYSRIKPTLLGALPWRWGDPEAGLLKRWARVVVTAWVLIVVPLLLSILVGAILALPRLMGTAWRSIGKQQEILAAAWVDGNMIQAVARVLSIVAIVIPVAGIIYMLVRIARQTVVSTARSTAGKPLMQAVALICGAFVLSGVAWAWWPREGNYLPIQPTEQGAFFNIELMPSVHSTASRAPAGPAIASRARQQPLVKGSQGVITALWDNRSRATRPTKNSPTLALILVPRYPRLPAGVVGDGGRTGSFSTGSGADRGWVFPFDRPMAPGPGDNQALAVNTRDRSVVYDTAFAMVWITDNSRAMNINDAEAYASCSDCAAVAVAYQVVFVVDSDPADDNVVAPQNLAGALNYNCVNCMTYALARQVFVTLSRPLSDTAMAQIAVVWAEATAYGYAVRAGLIPLNAIDRQLNVYSDRILAIVEQDQPGTIPVGMLPSVTTTATATSAPAAAPPPSPEALPSTSATPSPSETVATQAPSSSSTPEPTVSTSTAPDLDVKNLTEPTGTASAPPSSFSPTTPTEAEAPTVDSTTTSQEPAPSGTAGETAEATGGTAADTGDTSSETG